jgi:lactate dehydrogenase-like 2-hydroxyacid dehydrogenase
MKIFVLNSIAPMMNDAFVKRLQQLGDIIVDKNPKDILEVENILSLEDEKIIALTPIFSDWKFSLEAMKSIPKLKAIVTTSTSFSWIDIKAAKQLGIVVVNTRNFSTNAVADWGFMMAMNLARRIPLIIKDDFKLDYTKYEGIELKGRVAGVVGLGNIGKSFAEICEGHGMEVIYWSKNSRDPKFKFVELNELFKASDLIFPAVAQNDSTNALITDKMLKSMKKECIFISDIHNVYNHELLLEMVKEEKIYGYGFEDKPGSFNNYEGNVWAAPELAWCTKESSMRDAEKWFENIKLAVQGVYKYRVN